MVSYHKYHIVQILCCVYALELSVAAVFAGGWIYKYQSVNEVFFVKILC